MMLRRLLIVVFVGLLVSGSAIASADLEDDLEEIQRRIEEIERAVNAAGSNRTELVAELLETRDELAALVAELDVAKAELSDARDARSAQRDHVAALDRQLELALRRLQSSEVTMVEARADAEELTRNRYIGAGTSRGAAFVLAAESVTDIEAQLAYLDRIASISEEILVRFDALRDYQVDQRDRISAQEEEAAAELAELRSIERDLVAVRAIVAEQTDGVAAVAARQEQALADLDAELSRFSRELDQLEREQDRIEAVINGETTGDGSSPNALVRPVPGRVTSPFGPRTHPILGTVRMHTGIDMSAPYGQPIRAAASGRVRIRVSYGESVAAGDTIGESGSSGLATGPHLHFEVRIGGRPVDPLGYL
jgi:murein DD-endopeptidase MepM/ murein hydrolase activator NlpD